MSWSARLVVKNLEFSEGEELSNLEPKHHVDQFKAAKKVTLSLIRTGAFGEKTGSYNVTFSGHGNPGHVPTEGWADDFINIGVSQRRED